MTTNQAGLDLIKRYETCQLVVYDDGVGFATVGWGHRTSLPLGATITQAQADAWLLSDLSQVESAVSRCVTVPLNSNQFSALCSFVFNVGSGGFWNSTMLRKLNVGDFEGAAREFGRWVYGGGRVLDGLVERRADEQALFLTPAN